MRPEGFLYLTIEEVAESVIEEAFAALTGLGLPVVRGEIIDGDLADYHCYPGRGPVTGWCHAAGLQILDEDLRQEDGWSYRHFLLQSPTQS
jgi:hypothetical protein